MRSLLPFLLCAAVLAACGSRPAQVSRVAASYPRFADADPHDNIGQLPSYYPVHGVDVSRYQGDIDWRQVRAAGISFAYIKATEGGDVADPMFHSYRMGAAAAGVRQGAYHFYYFCRSAREQADWFMRNVPRDRNALPPVLDMEWNHKSRTCPSRPSAAQVRAEATVFLDLLEQHYGRRPLVYTTPDFYHENGLARLPRTQFWLRSVAAHPSERYIGEGWSFWQYTGTGIVPGIKRPVDINAFAGSVSQWNTWIE